jgi:GDPmannose 4,6-dehydratase
MKNRNAVIFGVTGQDGSYLSELLLDKGYSVVGVYRRSSVDTTCRISHLSDDVNFTLVCGDVADSGSVSSIITKYQPDECYNLAAQSHVGVSFEQPELTFRTNAIGVLNILEAIRNHSPVTRFYQASTSEMFGDNYTEDGEEKYQDEYTSLAPRSPYAVAKVAGHNLVHTYRESYGLHGSCGILFNHESERRGENFVTRKITKYVAALKVALDRTGGNSSEIKSSVIKEIIYWQGNDGATYSLPHLELGNLDSHRDWGHAEDYVRAMWLMLQQDNPSDYVIATGETYKVRDFLDAAFSHAGINDWSDIVVINPEFFRPAEVEYLRGKPDSAEDVLGWERKISFAQLAQRMVDSDIQETVKQYE